ncbi:MAG: hypothetical protein AABW51_02895 [Nanoarchaeota archaeon]
MAENIPVRANVYNVILGHDDLGVVSMGRSNTPYIYDMIMGALTHHSPEYKIVEVKDTIGSLRPSDSSSVRIIQDTDGLTQIILDAGKMGTCASSLNLNCPIEDVLDGLTFNLSTF